MLTVQNDSKNNNNKVCLVSKGRSVCPWLEWLEGVGWFWTKHVTDAEIPPDSSPWGTAVEDSSEDNCLECGWNFPGCLSLLSIPYGPSASGKRPFCMGCWYSLAIVNVMCFSEVAWWVSGVLCFRILYLVRLESEIHNHSFHILWKRVTNLFLFLSLVFSVARHPHSLCE